MALDLFRVSGGLQINDSTQILEGTSAPALDAPVGSLYTNTTTGGLYTKVAAGAGAGNWELLAQQDYVNTQITNVTNMVNALGNAFNYVGTVAGGIQSTPFDLTTLAAGGKDAGDYYKVATAGWFTDGTNTFQANVNDGIVWNTVGEVDKIDNTNSEVQGTASYVSVTGSTDTGFTVDLDAAFKTRMTNAETSITTLQSDVGTLQTDLTSLTNRVTIAETNITNLTTEVNSIETSVGLAANGTLVPFTGTSYLNSATSITNALTLLDTALSTAASGTSTEDGYIQAFIGKSASGVEMPGYSSTTQVTQGTSLEAAIGAVDAAIGADVTSNTIISASNSANANIQAVADFVENDAKETTATGVTTLSDAVSNTMMAKWIVWVQDATTLTNVSAYEIFAASNGTTVDFTRFGILKLGSTISGLAVSAALSGSGIAVSVNAGTNVNVRIKRLAAI